MCGVDAVVGGELVAVVGIPGVQYLGRCGNFKFVCVA